MARILAIEDEENLRFSMKRTLAKAGHEVIEAGSLREARTEIQSVAFDMMITDVCLGSENGLELVRELRADGFDGVIIVITGFGTVEAAVGAMRDGADDYLQKPISMEELALQVERWLDSRRVVRRLRLYERMEQALEPDRDVIGQSRAWLACLSLADRLATLPVPDPGDNRQVLPTMLLLGETGVGKGVLARYNHPRASAAGAWAEGRARPAQLPFIHVNCAALPPSLVESELFGHEKGAFTDAREPRLGLFEMAEGGTIFLDEISEMSPELQAKLLLVAEHGSFRRVGGNRERVVRARVIAASNQNLGSRVEAGAFRRDLYYRLNAFTLHIPPLRERQDDACLIADAMVERLARRYGRPARALADDARDAIRRHSWPGNVRELVNAIQRAIMLGEGPVISAPQLALHNGRPERDASGGGTGNGGPLTFDFVSGVHKADDVERALIIQALQHTRGNVSRAAKLIGMQRSSFRYRIDRYSLGGFVQEVSRL